MRNLPVFSGLALLVLFLFHTNSVESIASRESIGESALLIQPSVTSDTIFFCVENGNAALPDNNQYFLGEADPVATSCSVHIWTTLQVADACSDTVIYDVRVYLHNGMDFVQVIDPTPVVLDMNQQATLTFDTRSTTLPTDHEIALSGLPYTADNCGGADSNHRLIWTIVNECGDTARIEQQMRIEDCQKPDPICVGLSSVVIPSSWLLNLYAYDFDSGESVDDCTGYNDLLYSFNGSAYEPSRTYDCEDIECDGPSKLIEIWVADAGRDVNCNDSLEWHERNKDFCTTFLVFDVNSGNPCHCDPGPHRITSPGGAGIEDVQVDFIVNNDTVYQTFTDDQGSYDDNGFFNPLIQIEVIPFKDDNHKNGVSTLDLVLIQKHLLGLKVFETPYELIAADANNSESVSALDLVEVRKLILGLYTEFPNTRCWRFIAQPDSFPNLFNPWPFEETQINQGFAFNGDFIGVKIGDINGATNITHEEVIVRSASPVRLNIVDQNVVMGQELEIPLYYSGAEDLLGFQFTLQTQGLEFKDIKTGVLDIEQEHIGIHEEAITLSYGSMVPLIIDIDQPLFTLKFISTSASGWLSDIITLTSDITKAEAYLQKTGSDEEQVVKIGLRFTTTELGDTGFVLYQNVPNPFSTETSIAFHLPSQMAGSLVIYDVHGHEIAVIDREFSKGYNAVSINAGQIGGSGFYYYCLNAGSFSSCKKLLLLVE